MKSIPIPKLQSEDQERIAKYIHTAYENLDRANELEDQAQKELLATLEWTEDLDLIDEELASQ